MSEKMFSSPHDPLIVGRFLEFHQQAKFLDGVLFSGQFFGDKKSSRPEKRMQSLKFVCGKI